MKKLVLALIGLMSISTLTFGQTLTDEQIYKALKEKYDYESLVFDRSEEGNSDLIASINSDKFIKGNKISTSDLILGKVNVVTWKDGRKSYIIKFKATASKSLIVSVTNNNYSLPLNPKIIDNNVTTKGTGTIIVKTDSEEFSGIFDNGTNVSPSVAKKSCFRKCFDKAYDDICDGFIGCVAWYTNFMVPLITASFCAGYC